MPEKRGEEILVVGMDSLLGRHLIHDLKQRGRAVVWGTTRRLPIRDDYQLYLNLEEDISQWSVPSSEIKAAILCAGVTSQKACEENPEASRKVNVTRTEDVARKLAESGVFVVYLSTNLVFAGKRAFVDPAAVPDPACEYGRQKAEAERRILRLGNAAVVRFTKIVHADMPILRHWIASLMSGEVIHPFYDLSLAPVLLDDAVQVVRALATARCPGIYHFSATGDISYEYFARYLARHLGLPEELIQPVSVRRIPWIHAPRHTTLATMDVERLGVEAPSPDQTISRLCMKIRESLGS